MKRHPSMMPQLSADRQSLEVYVWFTRTFRRLPILATQAGNTLSDPGARPAGAGVTGHVIDGVTYWCSASVTLASVVAE